MGPELGRQWTCPILFNLHNKPTDADTYYLLISQMRKQRLRDAKPLAQGH